MRACEECKCSKSEKHHIVWSSNGGLNVWWNYKYLCFGCHKGKRGPHRNLQKDMKYKIALQKRLIRMSRDKQFLTSEDLHVIYGLSKSQVNKITKDLHLYKEGYATMDIIKIFMGDCLFSVETVTLNREPKAKNYL